MTTRVDPDVLDRALDAWREIVILAYRARMEHSGDHPAVAQADEWEAFRRREIHALAGSSPDALARLRALDAGGEA